MSITQDLKATESALRIPPPQRGRACSVNADRIAAQAMIAERARHRRELDKLLSVAKDVRRAT